MLEITSASNARYKYIKSLSRKKDRMKNREYTVEGKKSVSDAIALSKKSPETILSDKLSSR